MLARAPGDVTHANVAQVKRSPPPGRSPKEAAFPATPGANACDGPAIVKVEGLNPDHSRGPSREEPWSQSAVVALGLGVPVVGTAVDGLARILGGGRGVLVPPEAPHALAEALSRVLGGERPDPDPGPSPGRAYARQFTPMAAAAVYAGAYRQLLAGRARFGGPSVRRP